MICIVDQKQNRKYSPLAEVCSNKVLLLEYCTFFPPKCLYFTGVFAFFGNFHSATFQCWMSTTFVWRLSVCVAFMLSFEYICFKMWHNYCLFLFGGARLPGRALVSVQRVDSVTRPDSVSRFGWQKFTLQQRLNMIWDDSQVMSFPKCTRLSEPFYYLPAATRSGFSEIR